MTELSDCFERRLLTNTGPSTGLARKSLKQAEIFLVDAVDLINMDKSRMGTIALYNAFFHTSRALLFRDGIKERSHFCIARYVEEKYVRKGLLKADFLGHLDALRDARHETQYSLEVISLEIDMRYAVDICREFMKAVEGLIER
ncbi:MAG: HEPN domain-containing protein [Euryarchaeota archaeon]|nr:HEPN domain-containing protein [Euryarchaeota archaeon]MBU4340943.1 HEPN domain-containing protein [Euryarchaeota archaeon]MCG2736424.1 HEPN domain-containing protein [Candidatus Methanoperedenaceae archaeon]